MIILIDRESSWQMGADGNIVFKATVDGGEPISVQLDGAEWRAIQAEWSHDPLAGVEELSRQGHWAVSEGSRVWRIDFV